MKRVIQADESGHSPAEDASACMELLRLKLQNGLFDKSLGFVVIALSFSPMVAQCVFVDYNPPTGPSFGINEEETESMTVRLSRSKQRSTIVDIPNIARQHSIGDTHIVPCVGDDEVLRVGVKVGVDVSLVLPPS